MNAIRTPIGVLNIRGGSSGERFLTGGTAAAAAPASLRIVRNGFRGSARLEGAAVRAEHRQHIPPTGERRKGMERITRSRKRTWVLLGVVAVAAAMAAVGAYAYWTAEGTGSGSATVGTDNGVTITEVTFSGLLYPGGEVDVSFKVNNLSPNTSVNVHKVITDMAMGTNGITLMSAAGCDADWFTYSGATLAASPGVVIAASGTHTVTAGNGGTLSMSNEATTNQDACKDATFTLNLETDNSDID
jgi:hypothetical protein